MLENVVGNYKAPSMYERAKTFGRTAVYAGMVLAALAMAPKAKGAIVDITENDGLPALNSVTNNMDRLAWDYNIQNNALTNANWNENLTQAKLFDIYSVSAPTALQLAPEWSMSTLQTSPNYWDITLSANELKEVNL